MKGKIFAQKKHRHAFTLIELVIVLFIMAILLAVLVPSVGKVYENQQLSEQTRLIENDLIWLREEAKRTGEKATFQVTGTTSYSLTVIEDGERQVESRTLMNDHLSLKASAQSGSIIFEAKGTAYDKCTLTLQGENGSRKIIVNNLGRIRSDG